MMSLWSTRNRLQRQDRDVQIARVDRGDFVVAISNATGRRCSISERGMLRQERLCDLHSIGANNGQQYCDELGKQSSFIAVTLPMRL